MHKLTIYRMMFTDSDCYKAAYRQTQVGVQVHSTGANNTYLHRYVGPDDGRLGKNKYGNHSNQPGSTVCASAYIGRLQNGTVAVYQTLPWDYRCWLSGKGPEGNANKLGYIGFEICEDGLDNRAYFDQVMDAAALLTGHLCQLMGTDPWRVLGSYAGKERLAVMDHAELCKCGVASGHADIGHWLRRYGYTMSTFREWVRMSMEDGIEVQYIDAFDPGQQIKDMVDDLKRMEDEQVDSAKFYAKNGGYINIRDEPGGQAVAMIRPGSTCEAGEAQAGWRPVVIKGWVKEEFLK